MSDQEPSPKEISSVDFNARFEATQNQRNNAHNEAAVLCGQLALANKQIEHDAARIAELEEQLSESNKEP